MKVSLRRGSHKRRTMRLEVFSSWEAMRAEEVTPPRCQSEDGTAVEYGVPSTTRRMEWLVKKEGRRAQSIALVLGAVGLGSELPT